MSRVIVREKVASAGEEVLVDDATKLLSRLSGAQYASVPLDSMDELISGNSKQPETAAGSAASSRSATRQLLQQVQVRHLGDQMPRSNNPVRCRLDSPTSGAKRLPTTSTTMCLPNRVQRSLDLHPNRQVPPVHRTIQFKRRLHVRDRKLRRHLHMRAIRNQSQRPRGRQNLQRYRVQSAHCRTDLHRGRARVRRKTTFLGASRMWMRRQRSQRRNPSLPHPQSPTRRRHLRGLVTSVTPPPVTAAAGNEEAADLQSHHHQIPANQHPLPPPPHSYHRHRRIRHHPNVDQDNLANCNQHRFESAPRSLTMTTMMLTPISSVALATTRTAKTIRSWKLTTA
ncbi:hypothetical protein BCR44DRAFT_1283009 [Catenaria anguillulae PL171]|uniref:Uncharacterized protein n=1 Tax=Catenaria anguillulae PL171 TaxID=765915 RepID=A0A1Y2HW88_9FUNG|nr:hypothetical protein BCR44DRAFT_1283009 [Catenaria anguillulae PL171]